MSLLFHNLPNSSVFIRHLFLYINCCHEIHLDVTTYTFHLSITWFGLVVTVSSIKCFHDRIRRKTFHGKMWSEAWPRRGLFSYCTLPLEGSRVYLMSVLWALAYIVLRYVNFCCVTSEYTSFIWLLFTGNLSGLADCCWCVAENCCDVTHNKDAAILAFTLYVSLP